MRTISKTLLAILLLPVLSEAGTTKTSGLTLLNPSGARTAALAEAFAAGSEDVTAFKYNPASLGMMKTGQAAFLYRRGSVDDAQGQFLFGSPVGSKSGFGVGVEYYDGGDITISQGGVSASRKVQKDLALSLGYGMSLSSIRMGITGKYLSSELVEQYSAKAFALDGGLSWGLTSRLTLGAAIQNMGTGLKYLEKEEKLPATVRFGGSYLLLTKPNVTVFVDNPYLIHDKKHQLRTGLEAGLGLISLRAGYLSGSDLNRFSVGAGLGLGQVGLDYSFGMMDKLDAQHLVSVSLHFGGAKAQGQSVAKEPYKGAEKSNQTTQLGEKEAVSFPKEK